MVQYATAKVGAILVNVNPAYRTHELRYALASRAARCWSRRRAFQPDRLRGDDRRGPRRASRRCAQAIVLLGDRRRTWDGLPRARGRASTATRCASARPTLDFDDPINIQYTSGTTGFPKGATLSHHNILNNGYFVGERCGYTDATTASACRCPLYHCFGMVMGNLGGTHPRRRGGAARARRSTRGHARRGRRPSAARRSTACRRCSSRELEHPDFDDFDLSTLRTGIMAGSPCPVEVMKQVIERDAHGRGDHLLRHDRDLTGLVPVRARRRPRAAHRDRRARCTRTSSARSSTPRPAAPSRAASRASSAPAATR